MSTCARCGCKLTSDEIGITRKLINRGTETFYCVKCLALQFGISEEDVRRLIRNFKAVGCHLFS